MEIGDNARTCVVLGGRGFIGRSLVLELLQFGDWIIRVADSPHSLKLLPSEQDSLLSQALSSGRASYFHLDVLDETLVIKAIQGSSVVFYTDVTLEELDFYNCYKILVQGAKNVLKVCRECKVKRLIYNSSADVVFDGSANIRNGDESLQCPWKFQDMLSDLKAQAEALVLLANNSDGPLTCALRPSIVFGPGETDLVPLIVNRAKSGWAKYIVGIGENMSDFTYVDNVARAHICAEEALVSRAASVAGKAFFITNLEPMKLWEFVSLMVEEFGYLRPSVKLPDIIVWYILLLVRWKHEKLGTIKLNRSSSDPYMFHLATRTRVFNCTAAKTYLGYSPIVSVRDGIMLTAESFSHLASDSPFNRYVELTEESKVDKMLGSGKVAEIFLWRDEKITFAYFLALATLFDWFFLRKRNFISSAAELLVLITIYLHSYIFLPPTIFGITVPRISSSNFQISETGVKCSITALTHRWNTWARAVKCLARGDDWSTFIKMAGPLYLLALCLSHSVNLVMGGVLVFSFTCFFIYEQYESEIDGSAIIFHLGVQELNALLRRQLPPAVLYVFKGGKSNLRRRDHFTKFCC